jgi:SAM-dependent methyltransferase
VSDAPELDLQQVLREIDEEVRARRAAGEFPPGMERELDLLFARFAPPTVSGDDLDGLLEAAERTSYIDHHPPTGSSFGPLTLVKRVEWKLLGWFFRFVTQQVTAFAGIVVQALRLLGRRVDALEHATPGADAMQREAAMRAGSAADVGPVADVVAEHMAGIRGRVLVAECGDGSLLRRLADLDVYGVEPRPDLAESASLAGLDVRADGAVEHLRVVDDDALHGLVIMGIVDRSPLGVQLRLIERAVDVLAGGGRLAVVGTSPDAWGRGNPIEADLSPGRPLHAETWAHVLEHAGFSDVRVTESGERYAVTARR